MEHLRTNARAVLLYGISVNPWMHSLSGSVGFGLAEGKQPTEQWSRTGHSITLETSYFFANLRSSAYLPWSQCHVLLNAEVLVLVNLGSMTVWAKQEDGRFWCHNTPSFLLWSVKQGKSDQRLSDHGHSASLSPSSRTYLHFFVIVALLLAKPTSLAGVQPLTAQVAVSASRYVWNLLLPREDLPEETSWV